MDKEWIKPIVSSTVALIIAIVAGMWTVFVHLDSRFDRIEERFDDIDTRLARVEGFLEGRFNGTSEATIPDGVEVSQDTLVIGDLVVLEEN